MELAASIPVMGSIEHHRTAPCKSQVLATPELWPKHLTTNSVQLLDNRCREVNSMDSDISERDFKEHGWWNPHFENEVGRFTTAAMQGQDPTKNAGARVQTASGIDACAGSVNEEPLEEALQAVDDILQRGFTVPPAVFLHLLQRCINEKDQIAGKEVQSLIVRGGLELDAFLGSHLVRLYSTFDSLSDLNQMFSRLSEPNVFSWTAIISTHTKLGQNEEALELYNKMQDSSVKPDGHVFVAALKACSNMLALDEGKLVHTHIVESGFEFNVFVANTLIDMYSKCGSLKDAHVVFDTMLERDIVTWNTLITGYSEHQHGQEALWLFQQMQLKGVEPDRVTFVCLLEACSTMAFLEQGKHIHALIIEVGLESDVYIGTTMVSMYGKCGSLMYARIAFNKMQKNNVEAWNAFLVEYVHHGHIQEALQVFQQMQEGGLEPDSITFASMLKACSSIDSTEQGQLVHIHMIGNGLELDVYVGNVLIDMYMNCGSLLDALRVFNRLHARDVVTWTALVGGYIDHGHSAEALLVFQQMQQESMEPNEVTVVCILKACSIIGATDQGRQIHALAVFRGLDSNVFVGNTLIDMYCKFGSLNDAFTVFESLASRDVITWNALIADYALNGYGDEAFHLYKQMQLEGFKPDLVTYISLLKVCSVMAALQEGRELHNQIIQLGLDLDLSISNTLIDMYSKCGNLDDACMVFVRLSKQDVVTWNALMSGYVQHGHGHEALRLFQKMQHEGMEPNQVTLVIMLKACSSVAALGQGRHIHLYVIACGLESDVFLNTALIGMYGNCGSLKEATLVFERVQKQNVATWNALISEYAHHSNYTLALQVFEDMHQSGYKPNEVTFVCLLSACSHVGQVDEGCHHFKFMRDGYCIKPTLEHFISMVDLLGHAGCLNEAEDLLETLPIQPNDVGWRSLLSSCRTHGNVDLGRRCFHHVITMEPRKAAAYVLMSNIYADAGLLENAEEIENIRRCANIWKKPAKSFIEVGERVYEFIVGDKNHPRSEEIYEKVRALSTQMREEGYIAHSNLVQNPILKEDKEDALCGHSERLALAFGLLSTPHGTTLRVAKNLRVCADCHKATNLISKIENREIVVLDAYRIHHVKDGVCSCNEYYQ